MERHGSITALQDKSTEIINEIKRLDEFCTELAICAAADISIVNFKINVLYGISAVQLATLIFLLIKVLI